VIYEVVTEGSAPASTRNTEGQKVQRAAKKEKSASADADEDRSSDPTVGVGSVAAGGRYDELVGMFKVVGRTPEHEDEIYSLLGIFGVTMPLIYGEGKDRASRRLDDEISMLSKGRQQYKSLR